MPEYLTADQLKQILDEKLDQKLIPLNLKVSELSTKLEDAMQFIDLANSKYEEVIRVRIIATKQLRIFFWKNFTLKYTF